MLKNHMARYYTYTKQLLFLQRRTTNTDVFLSSYPKSGNTWARFILGNIYTELLGNKEKINFHSIHKYIPEVGNTPILDFGTLPRVFKTHSTYRKHFKKVIYIVRDPFDTLYSYYQYLNGEKGINITIQELVHHSNYGIDALVNHIESYLRGCERLLLISYEDMHHACKECVMKMCRFLNINPESGLIKSAIEKSSFRNMRTIEQKKGRPMGNKNFTFTRSGVIGEGNKIPQKEREYIIERLTRSPFLYFNYVRSIDL